MKSYRNVHISRLHDASKLGDCCRPELDNYVISGQCVSSSILQSSLVILDQTISQLIKLHMTKYAFYPSHKRPANFTGRLGSQKQYCKSNPVELRPWNCMHAVVVGLTKQLECQVRQIFGGHSETAIRRKLGHQCLSQMRPRYLFRNLEWKTALQRQLNAIRWNVRK